jgi:valyl-tRNA synthetase
MIMMGLEFAGDVPFDDVYVHSVILAPDGRRMSKSLGTGIDPIEAISEHGADALRFGLMAMSSSQDVRYSTKRVEQGRDLANKMWNASRLILLNTDPVAPEPRPETVEDRWMLSRLQHAIGEVTKRFDAYDFSHGALELYSFFWSELCDWYLEMVKVRLYESDDRSAVSATLLHVLGETLALIHPVMPFVTEEIYSFIPERTGQLVVRAFPEVDASLIDEEAERDVERVVEATRRLRSYRNIIGIPAAARVPARLIAEGLYDRATGTIERLARFDFGDGTDNTAGLNLAVPGGTVVLLPNEIVDIHEAKAKIASYVEHLRSEKLGAERRLENESFVDKAPEEVVRQWREKLAGFERELAELET